MAKRPSRSRIVARKRCWPIGWVETVAAFTYEEVAATVSTQPKALLANRLGGDRGCDLFIRERPIPPHGDGGQRRERRGCQAQESDRAHEDTAAPVAAPAHRPGRPEQEEGGDEELATEDQQWSRHWTNV